MCGECRRLRLGRVHRKPVVLEELLGPATHATHTRHSRAGAREPSSVRRAIDVQATELDAARLHDKHAAAAATSS